MLSNGAEKWSPNWKPGKKTREMIWRIRSCKTHMVLAICADW